MRHHSWWPKQWGERRFLVQLCLLRRLRQSHTRELYCGHSRRSDEDLADQRFQRMIDQKIKCNQQCNLAHSLFSFRIGHESPMELTNAQDFSRQNAAEK